MGNEEETMLMAGDSDGPLDEPFEFVTDFETYLPSGLSTVPAKESVLSALYTQNGGLIYDGGALGDDGSFAIGSNLERATPECGSPKEAATYIEANEKLLVSMLAKYARLTSEWGYPQQARVHRRTVDPYGNTKACHDSVEIATPGWQYTFERNSVNRHVLLGFLATRSFIVGAGYVNDGNLYFAQKVQHLRSINGYGYFPSVYRDASDSDTGPRFEFRANDINIQPWSLQARIGGSVLMLTMLQTPIGKRLAGYFPEATRENQEIAAFKRFNRAPMDEEGNLKFSVDTVRAIDFQERALELMADELPKYTEVPEEYLNIVESMREYCVTFRSILHGSQDISVLRNVSDIGAKFSTIARSLRKDHDFGIPRQAGDIRSQALDLRYDLIEVMPGSNPKKPVVRYGYGYKLREDNCARRAKDDAAAEKAIYTPPQSTRAKVRGSWIKSGVAEACMWNRIWLVKDSPLSSQISNPFYQPVPTIDRAANGPDKPTS